MACPEVAGIDPRLVLYDRRHADVFELWLKRLGDADAAEDAAQWALLGGSDGDLSEAPLLDLPVAARTALVLRDVEGLGYAEVAERLGVAEPTAKRIVYIARVRLVEALRRLRHAFDLAPLLGWLKSTGAGLTAAKGVAAVAALGAAAGLSALAVPAHQPTHQSKPAPARQPARPAESPPTRIDRVAPRNVERVRPSASVPAPSVERPEPTPPVVHTPIPSDPPAAEPPVAAPPASEPAAATEIVQEPVVEPVVPTVEAPLDPVVVEPSLPLDVPVTVPDLGLPAPLPLP